MSAVDSVIAAGLAKADAARRYTPRRGLRPVARNLHLPTRAAGPNNLSDGVSTGITTRLEHVTDTACSGLRLAFSNYYNNGGTDADGVNPITVKSYIKTGDGTYWPVFFNGTQAVTIAPGATVLSDPVGPHFAKGDTFITQTYVSVTSGQKYPLGLTTNSTTGTEGVVAGDSAAGTVAASTTKGYGPWAILGTPAKGTASPVGLFVGDSRVVGYGDTKGSTDSFGWVRRAFDGNLSYLNVGVSGSTAQIAQTQGGLRRRLALADRCTFDFAFVAYGINDLAAGKTGAQVQSYLAALFAVIAARGLPIYSATLAPVTTTTNNFADTAGQTAAAWNAERVAVNTWLRTIPAPLTRVYDFADAVETARNSGIWKSTGTSFGYTSDGTHESVGGYTAEAVLIDPAGFGGPILTA